MNRGFQTFGRFAFKSFTKSQSFSNAFVKTSFKKFSSTAKAINKKQLNECMAALTTLTSKFSLIDNSGSNFLEELSGDQDDDTLSHRNNRKSKRKGRRNDLNIMSLS